MKFEEAEGRQSSQSFWISSIIAKVTDTLLFDSGHDKETRTLQNNSPRQDAISTLSGGAD
jgi:hypothetical protein